MFVKKQLFLNLSLMIVLLLLGTFINVFVLKIAIIIMAAMLMCMIFSTAKKLLNKCETIDDADKYKQETEAAALAFKQQITSECTKEKEKWEEEIVRAYHLNLQEREELKEAIIYSKKVFKINVENFEKEEKDLILMLARKVDNMDEKEKNNLKQILFK